MAAILAVSATTYQAINNPRVAVAYCSENHITLYMHANGVNPAQSFCLESVGNLSNLLNVPGPCIYSSWNDCVSSVRIKLSLTQCFKTYAAANFISPINTYWGAENEVLHNVSQNDVMSSVKQYAKVPATPAGNC